MTPKHNIPAQIKNFPRPVGTRKQFASSIQKLCTTKPLDSKLMLRDDASFLATLKRYIPPKHTASYAVPTGVSPKGLHRQRSITLYCREGESPAVFPHCFKNVLMKKGGNDQGPPPSWVVLVLVNTMKPPNKH